MNPKSINVQMAGKYTKLKKKAQSKKERSSLI